jgi:hypothetical protein
MTGLALAVASMVFASGLSVAVWRWRRRRESALFVLRLLPASLLLVVAPLLAGAWDITQGFVRIASEGVGGRAMVVATLSAALDGQLAGTLLFVLAVTLCAALQAFTAVPAPGQDGDGGPPADAVERWLPVAAPALMLPAHFLWHSTHVTTGFIAAAVPVVDQPSNAPRLSSEQIAAVSSTIAERLVNDQLMGFVVTGLLALSTVALLLYTRHAPASRHVAWLSWAAVVVAVAGGVAGAVTILGDLQLLEGL